ncbi:hypothetical protein [Flavobacterium frigidarium]|uniref:hypothetical protein n=1 Tax=Flavobacterium frigidarium TaxID=99286 RepID=UPI0030DC7EF6|tara:strand:+ start:6681 stop:7406 length:726 start_codon:yes stop_codon:yes gene_type:complete
MKKSILLLLALALFVSCEVVETINITPDNTGTIVVDMHRNENSYMQIAGEQYAKETIFKDTTYVFQDYIEKYNGNFVKYTATEQELFNKYKNVKVHIKKSSFDKDFRTIISQDFTNVEEAADLSKTENYISDIVHNYALTAEEHYYNIKYTLKDNQFNRVVTVTNEVIFEREKKILESYNKIYDLNLVQSYLLKYHFPRKIKSVSNANAIISSDRKSLELKFAILDFLKNPVSTNLEVVLE